MTDNASYATPPTIGSLFAGIGGFELAFSRAGFQPVWSVEIDKDGRKVLRHHFPDTDLHTDVRGVGAHNLAPVDVITFGSPCQDLSVAGRRAGLEGERSGLFYEAVRIVGELKPAVALWENVPGALSSNAGRDFAAVLAAFRELGARDIGWRVLDAQYFGVPQRRRRIFLVADFGGERAAEVLFESESMRGDIASRRSTGSRLATSVAASLKHGGGNGRGYNLDAESGLADDGQPDTVGPLLGSHAGGHRIGADEASGGQHVAHPAPFTRGGHGDYRHGLGTTQASGGDCGPGSENLITDAIAGSDTTRYGKGPNTTLDDGAIVAFSNRGIEGDTHETLPAGSHGALPMVAHSITGERTHALTSDGSDASEDGTGRGTPIVFDGAERVVNTLRANAGMPNHAADESKLVLAFDSKASQELTVNEDLAPTLKVAAGDGGGGQPPAVALAENQRGELYTSAATNRQAVGGGKPGQGYAAALTAYGVRRLTPMECERLQGFPDGWTEGISDSGRYRMLGNSVAVPCVQWIAARLYAALCDGEEAAS